MYLSCTCLCIETCFYYLNKYFKLRTFRSLGSKRLNVVHTIWYSNLLIFASPITTDLLAQTLKTLTAFMFYFSGAFVSRWFMTNFESWKFTKKRYFNITKKSILELWFIHFSIPIRKRYNQDVKQISNYLAWHLQHSSYRHGKCFETSLMKNTKFVVYLEELFL